MDKNELVEAVKKHALANYENKYGWSQIVECFSDEDVREEFVDEKSYGGGNTVVPAAASPEDAIARASRYVDLVEGRYREAVGPDTKCETCGKTYLYEVGHWCGQER